VVTRAPAHPPSCLLQLDDDRTGIQAELGKLTGATSVPRVFISGKFLGGGDDTVAAAQSGKLAQLCKAAGVL
jgi:glutaredoxin 3